MTNKKSTGGGYLSGEDKAHEMPFIRQAAEALAQALTEGTDLVIRYDSEHKRWVYLDKTEDPAGSSAYLEDFLREFEQMRKCKVRCGRYLRGYSCELTEWMEELWGFCEWIKASLRDEPGTQQPEMPSIE